MSLTPPPTDAPAVRYYIKVNPRNGQPAKVVPAPDAVSFSVEHLPGFDFYTADVGDVFHQGIGPAYRALLDGNVIHGGYDYYYRHEAVKAACAILASKTVEQVAEARTRVNEAFEKLLMATDAEETAARERRKG